MKKNANPLFKSKFHCIESNFLNGCEIKQEIRLESFYSSVKKRYNQNIIFFPEENTRELILNFLRFKYLLQSFHHKINLQWYMAMIFLMVQVDVHTKEKHFKGLDHKKKPSRQGSHSFSSCVER